MPELEPVEQADLDMLENVGVFESPLDNLVKQIQSGFGEINIHNELAEKATIEAAQEEQDSAIEEVMDEANDEAAEVIEDESDVSEAAEEISEIFEDQQETIAAINKDHDEDIVAISKKSIVAKIANENIMTDVINNVVGAAFGGADVNQVIVDADLPFHVETPSDEAENPANKLERILNRAQGEIDSVKRDPEFNAFLSGVVKSVELKNREDLDQESFEHQQASEVEFEAVNVIKPNGPRGPARP